MKKDDILTRLIQFVKTQKIERGDKLPPERELALILETSRATVREALRMLEERGFVTVRRSSGIFLNKNAAGIDIEESNQPSDEETFIRDQLESYFLFLPLIIPLATARATGDEISALQGCIVAMSRAIVTKDINALLEADNEFHRLLAKMTKNHKIYRIVQVLNSGREIFWDYFIKNDEFIRKVVFAGYVELANAIKSKEPEEAAARVKRNILEVGEQISGIKNIKLYEIVGPTEKISQF